MSESEDDEESGDSDKSSDESRDESSSDDEHQWKQSVKEQYKQIKQENQLKKRQERRQEQQSAASSSKQPKFYELKDGLEYFKPSSNNKIVQSEKLKKLPLVKRLEHESTTTRSRGRQDETMVFRSDSMGNKQMTFVSRREKRDQDAQKRAMEHHQERKGIRRSAGRIIKSLQTKKPSSTNKFFKK